MVDSNSRLEIYSGDRDNLSVSGTRSTVDWDRNGLSEHEPPTLPPRFKPEARIGAGGMGTVYRVRDEEIGGPVALKTLNELSPDQIYYLKTEFRAVATIRHPNLVRLYELFVADRVCFFTMELVDGSDMLSFVRKEGKCDIERLLMVAGQLASAIRAIHLARKIHRDVKPSNVLVSGAGRLVLLDFGLIAPFRSDVDSTAATAQLAGTVGYMPPEQAIGVALDASADWYAFGATLFEAATGSLPFEPRRSLYRTARDQDGPRIRETLPDFPEDLDELVARLLDPEPAARPRGEEVVAAFARSHSRPSAAPPSRALLGRERELAVLSDALNDVLAGRTILAYVHGPSGIGKTEASRHFVESAERGGAIALRGRCHPLESVPYNALDGMIDELSQWLQSPVGQTIGDGCAEHVRDIGRLFPVLTRADEALAGTVVSSPDASDVEIPTRSARSLRELFWALSRAKPLVVWLDDMQWGDEDSGRVLRELVRTPDAPPFLLLLSYRTEDRQGSRALALLPDEAAGDVPGVIDVALRPLSHEDTLALVAQVASAVPSVSSAQLDSLVRQAQGNPFFAREIGRAVAESAPPNTIGEFALDGLLAQRVRALSEPARRLVEVVCVAGAPLEPEYLLRAAGLGAEARPVLYDLESDCLVRSTQTSTSKAAEVYHHRVRDAVLGLLDDASRRAHHSAIATAMLSATQPNYSRVVEHLDAAGDIDAVRRHVLDAARQAEAVFAFDSAARWYARALEVGDVTLDEVELQECLGTVLGGAGRGREAGGVFERAALRCDETGTAPERSLSLRKRAAEQYLKSWQREDAARALKSVLGPLGIQMPKSRSAAMVETLVNRGYVWWHGLEPKPSSMRAPTQPLVADRLGVLLLLMQVYGMTEHTYGFAFGSRLLREGLSAGSSDLLLNGLACESVAWAALSGSTARRTADKHLQAIERACLARPTTYSESVLHQCRGITHFFRGEFVEAVSELEVALTGLKRVTAGVTVDLATNFAFRLNALGFLGRLREQGSLLDRALADAQARGDDYLVATCAAGHSTLGWLLTGRKRECLQWAERVLSLAPPGFSSQHFHYFVTGVNVDLLEGRELEAWSRVSGHWQAIKDNHFLSLSCVGEDLRQTRARVAIAAALRDVSAREQLLQIARNEARLLEKSSFPCASAWSSLLHAGIASVRGDRAQAGQLLQRGIDALAARGMSLYAAAARYALSELQVSQALRAAAEAQLTSLGVKEHRAVSAMLVPGWRPASS